MLDVPGWLDSHRLPNAVAVVSALKKIARVRLDLQQVGPAGAPRHDIIDLERDADAEQQRQRDDVGEVERQADQHADLQRHRARDQQRHQRQQHVGEAPQRDPQQEAITSSAQMPAWMKALTTVSPDLRIETGPPIAVGSAASTAPANLRSVSLSLGSPFGSASTRVQAVLGLPGAHEIRRQRLQA